MIQSSYIPWRGYFDFIDDVDLFIFYDDVQYTRRDWRNRNKIKTREGTAWLTIPVHYHHDPSAIQLICDSRIDYSSDWSRKHLLTLKQWYHQARYFETYYGEFSRLFAERYPTLSELNITLCQWTMTQLAIHTPLKKSVEFSPQGEKTPRILDILKKVGADSYLVGPEAKSYLEEDLFQEAGIHLEYKSYEYPPYPQLWGDFTQGVSVLDLLFNVGPDARKYLKSSMPNIQAGHGTS